MNTTPTFTTMPSSKRLLRSLKDIRTCSGRPSKLVVPYKAYMAITALEMERSRRETERSGLWARLKNVDSRIRAIDLDKTALLRGLGMPKPRSQTLVAAPAPRRGSTPPRTMGGFKIKY